MKLGKMEPVHDGTAVNEKKVSGAKIGIIVAVIAVLVALVAFVLWPRMHSLKDPNDGSSGQEINGGQMVDNSKNPEENDPVAPANSEEPVDDTLVGKTEMLVYDEAGNEIDAPDIDRNGGWVAQYTTIETNKQSLIKLVKTTLYGMNYTFEQTLKDVNEESWENGTLGNLLRNLKDGADPKSELPNEWEVNGKWHGIKFSDDVAGWTVEDWCAAVGNWFFQQGELAFAESTMDRSLPYLKSCMMDQVFLADVNNDLDHWELAGLTEEMYGAYEVNYTMDFTWNGQKHRALIGNRNGEYVVLDVIDPSKLNVKPQEKNPVPANNGEVTIIVKNPEPSKEPAPVHTLAPQQVAKNPNQEVVDQPLDDQGFPMNPGGIPSKHYDEKDDPGDGGFVPGELMPDFNINTAVTDTSAG